MDLSKLKGCFEQKDIEWRLQQAGTKKDGSVWAKCLAYVTNRAIMNRLDEVCGPENWKNEFTKAPDGGVLCGISIKVDGEWVTKWDGAENTDIEGVKGGLSSSMKRSAVQWGIGRYLYDLEEGWAVISNGGKFSGKTKDGKWFNWDPPQLPRWALPGGRQTPPPARQENKRSSSPEKLQEEAARLEEWIASDIWDVDKKNGRERRKTAEEAVNDMDADGIARHLDYVAKLLELRKKNEKRSA